MRSSIWLTALLMGSHLLACTTDLDLLGGRRVQVGAQDDAGSDAGNSAARRAEPREAQLPAVGTPRWPSSPVEGDSSDVDSGTSGDTSSERSEPVLEAGAEVSVLPEAGAPTTPEGGTPDPEDASTPNDVSDAAVDGGLEGGAEGGPPSESEAGPLPEPTECQLACAAAGGRCAQESRCEFDCSKPGACVGEIECPEGYACFVACGDQSCRGKIWCSDEDADDCRVECLGTGSCAGGIECRGGACDVACEGAGSCGGTGVKIRGRANATANVSCSGEGSCSCEVGSRCDAVDCAIAHCNVECSGEGSCGCVGSNCGSVVAAAQTILTRCSGAESCNGNVSCSGNRCDVRCNRAEDACGGAIYCNTGQKLGDCP